MTFPGQLPPDAIRALPHSGQTTSRPCAAGQASRLLGDHHHFHRPNASRQDSALMGAAGYVSVRRRWQPDPQGGGPDSQPGRGYWAREVGVNPGPDTRWVRRCLGQTLCLSVPEVPPGYEEEVTTLPKSQDYVRIK